jgi:hypothetical protein
MSWFAAPIKNHPKKPGGFVLVVEAAGISTSTIKFVSL